MPALDGCTAFGALPQSLYTTGNVFYVDSGTGNDRYVGDDPKSPKATMVSAMDNCTANHGDIIYLMPGHTEEVPGDDFTLDTAGVSIIGIRQGARGPTFNGGGSGAMISLDASSIRLSNIIWNLEGTATTTNVGIDITANGDGCIVDNCLFLPHATSQFTDMIQVSGAAADICIVDNQCFSLESGAGATSAINFVAAVTRGVVTGNVISGHFGVAGVEVTAATVDAVFARNTIHNGSSSAGDLAIDLHDSSTGICAWNALSGGLALASNFDPGNCHCVENYLSDAIDTHAVLVPATVST